MLMVYLFLLVVLVAGWVLGRMRPPVDLGTFVFALFGSVTAHSAMQWAFLEGRLDGVVGDPRSEVPAAAVILIAAGEAIGLWLPFLLIPWARPKARIWVVLYALATVTLAAVYFYFPFDVGPLSAALTGADGPPYLFAAIACLPIAGLICLVGYSTSYHAFDDDP